MQSIRVVALTRRLRQEREALRALAGTLTQGEDGKWRQNGKFVTKEAVSAHMSARENHSKVIEDISGKLKELGTIV